MKERAIQSGVSGSRAFVATRTLLALVCLVAAAGMAPAQTKYVLLHTFAGGPADGEGPDGTPILDSAGNLYGTTFYGGPDGNSSLYSGFGTVYKVEKSGHETVLHGFTGEPDGAWPVAGVIDSAGNLYGTTSRGGVGGYGVVYKLDSSGNETVLHTFTGEADGANPYAGVVRDKAGNLYGTADFGGKYNFAVVFKLTP